MGGGRAPTSPPSPKAAHDGGAIVKVIFENCYLNDDQKIRLCQICGEVGRRLREDLDRLRHRRRHASTTSA